MVDTIHIVTFGEVLWDIFPAGKQLGGAPFNVAAHSRILGAKSYMISAVGQDEAGKAIIQSASQLGVNTDGVIMDESHPTGTVQVSTDDKGQPSYDIIYPVAWDFIRISESAIQMVQSSDAFVFGSLACRNEISRNTLWSLLPHASTRVLDLNIRQNYYSKELIHRLLNECDILKLNDEELDLLGVLYLKSSEELPVWLLEQFNMQLIIVTLGSKGAMAQSKKQKYRAAGVPVQVVNTVGSGDAFLAAFLVNYLKKTSIQTCLELACERGAYVATQPGAIPK